MNLSYNQCCKNLFKPEKSEFEDKIRKVGRQKVVFDHTLSQIMKLFTPQWVYFQPNMAYFNEPYCRVSKCHGHTGVCPRKIFLTLRNIFRFVCANRENSCFFPLNLHFFANILTI